MSWITKLMNIGIEEQHLHGEKMKIKALNQIAWSGIFVVSIMAISDAFKLDIKQVLIDLLLNFFMLMIVVLHYFKKQTLAQYYFIYVLSLVSTLVLIVFGNQVKCEYMYFLFAVAAVVFIDDPKTVNWTCFYLVIQFIIQKTILFHIPYLIKVNMNYIDYIVPFFGFFNATMFIIINFKQHFTNKESELRTLLAENEQNNNQLKTVNGELERFAHSASHDLKSPLRTIVSFMNIIERKIAKKQYDDLGEYIQYAIKGGEQMNSLVNDILKFSTIGAGHSIPTEEVDLNEVFSTVKHQLLTFIEEKNATLGSEKLPTLDINKMLITILFQNLIENGLKYNKSKQPKVEVKYQIVNNSHEIAFHDNGIGISKEYHEKIFDLFYRLHSVETYQGTGMGLAICKKIVNQMNGELYIQSEVGKGSIFMLRFEKM